MADAVIVVEFGRFYPSVRGTGWHWLALWLSSSWLSPTHSSPCHQCIDRFGYSWLTRCRPSPCQFVLFGYAHHPRLELLNWPKRSHVCNWATAAVGNPIHEHPARSRNKLHIALIGRGQCIVVSIGRSCRFLTRMLLSWVASNRVLHCCTYPLILGGLESGLALLYVPLMGPIYNPFPTPGVFPESNFKCFVPMSGVRC